MKKQAILYFNNLVRASPLIILITAAILLILAFRIKNNGLKKPKLKRKMLANIKAIYKKIVDLGLSKESFSYLASDLKKLNKNFTVYSFYAVKLGLFLTAAILSASIFITNFNYKSSTYIQQELTEEDIKLYTELKDLYSSENLQNSVLEIRKELINKGFGMSAANIKTIKLFTVMKTINDMKFNFIRDIWFVVIPFICLFIPNLAIKLLKKYKESMYQRDLPILKVSTYLLADMGVKVKDILYFLEPLTPTYREVFKKGIKNFTSTQLGPAKAVMEMTQDVSVFHFRKLCNSLRDMLLSNKEQAVRNLEIDINMEEKENQMRIEAKIERNSIIAIFLIVPILLLLLLIILCPMLEYLQNFNLTM